MSQDIDIGSISPPQPRTDNTVDVRRLTESEFEVHVGSLLASVGEVPSGSGEGVASLVAVWVISQVEDACGAAPLVDLKTLTRDDFATPTALSGMLYRRIREQDAPLVES